MKTRKERINAQIERSKRHQRQVNARKLGKLSLFTGTTLGLTGFFANSMAAKAVSQTPSSEKTDNSLPVSNTAPDSKYNFSNGLSQVTYMTKSQYNFLSSIGPTAQKLASENNLYASIMIAQAIIESGWGQSGLASAPNYNLFGVKGSYQGSSVAMPTFEQTPDGVSYSIVANFAKYPSYEDSMKGYIRTMLNPLYVGAWRSTTSNYQQAARYLTGRYATAVNYGDTLISMIQKYNLTAFDSDEFSVDPTIKGIGVSNQKETYTIQKGDSLWGISRKFNVSFNELLKLNDLKPDSKIFPNQIITIKEIQNFNIPNVEIVPNAVGDSTNKPSLPLPTVSGNEAAANRDSGEGNYTVQKGDTLYRIALKNGISLAELLKINNMTESSLIVPGQKLKISKPVAVPNDNIQTPSINGNEYIIQKGDNLYRIATKAGISINELLKLNNLQADSIIVPGQKLIIRDGQTNQNTAPSTENKGTYDEKIESANYIVKSGDNLYNIAKRAGISFSDLLNLNNLKEDSQIVAGQILLVKLPIDPKPSDVPDSQHQEDGYIVQKGDNLYGIARKVHMNLSDLLTLNKLTASSVIVPGQKLIVKSSDVKDSPSDSDHSKQVEAQVYEIKVGDTLYHISKTFQISISDLLQLNDLNENSVILPGQKLIVKAAVKSENEHQSDVQDKKSEIDHGSNNQNNGKVASEPQKTYTVKQGDSLYKIATANKTTVNILEQINDLPGGLILPGQVINIP